MFERAFRGLLELAVADGATTPAPGGSIHSIIWSTTENAPMFWTGSAWSVFASGGGGSGDQTASSLTNDQGSTIAVGSPVYASGAGLVALAKADAEATAQVIGVVGTGSITNGAAGDIATTGIVTAATGVWDARTGDTGGLVANARYWLSTTTAGALTTDYPTSGFAVLIGIGLSTTQLQIRLDPVVGLN